MNTMLHSCCGYLVNCCKVDIRVKYADEDIGSNCGWYALCKGDFVDDGYPSKGNAAIDFACNIWGYDANAYRAEMSLL